MVRNRTRKKNMKALKKSNQVNAIINDYYYSKEELENAYKNDFAVFKLYDESEVYRVSFYKAEIKVVLDEYGYYTNQVITHTGSKYYVIL